MVISASRARFAQRLLALAGSVSVGALASPAWADCTADSTGLVVACSGTSATYTNTASGVAVSAASGGTVTGPLVIGDNGSLANAGTISGALTTPVVQFGANAAITNTGTISSSSSATTTAAIQAGDNSTVTNSGTLTAVGGTPAVALGANGSFTDTSSATAAIIGNITFGPSSGAQVSRFTNQSTTYGLSGAVLSTGNTAIDNAGAWTGAFTQVANGGSVSFVNEAGATYTGVFTTGDATALANAGTMTLGAGSTIGAGAAAASGLTNTGTLTIGLTTAPAAVTVNGGFVQGAAGVLNIALKTPGSAALAAGTNFGQLALTGSGGSAALGGTLNLQVAAGFYPTGATYKLIVADQGISGDFAAITGNSFAFMSFVPLGVVTVSGAQQAYEFQVQRTQTYAQALAGIGTASQLTIATALQPLVTAASAAPAGAEATLVGQVDVLTTAQAQAFLDAVSPQGYLAYAQALRDQGNMWTRAVGQRLGDFNGAQPTSGWWGSGMGQFQFGGGGAGTSKSKLFGLNMGYDFSGSNYVVGVSGTASWNKLAYAGGTMDGTNRALGLGAYGGYNLGPLHLTGQVGYLFGHLSATKTVAVGTATDTAKGLGKEHLLKANATAGLDLKAAGMTFEPFVGIDFASGRIDGFTETGAGAASLTLPGISATRTDLLAGMNVTRSTGKWRPYLRAQYRMATGSAGDSSVTAWFDGNTATTFTVAGLAPVKHEMDIDGGMNIVFEDEGSLFVGYQGTLRSGYSAHGINAGIRLQF
ncbi:MAG: autotransporter domain-containing protein [Sphingomonadales bacterium]|nr:autotransporter domain-containing protein [Sphingomonadales bacterium]